VSLTDDADGVAAFTVTNMVPGSEALRSVTVTNTGSQTLDVRLYGVELTGDDLAGHINLRIGTALAEHDVFDGTLAEFAEKHSTYVAGTIPIRLAAHASQTYYFWTELDSDTPAAFQNTRASIDFAWRGYAP
jgi:hypothetical protein